uniref:MIP20383p n=1 Tax=Drosophila melanogaster TaxID=7227 RepID=D5A7M8_DROME|nr:MIP20383p [Drosophila melanogaster]
MAAADDVWYATNCCMAFQTNVRCCFPLCLSCMLLSLLLTW